MTNNQFIKTRFADWNLLSFFAFVIGCILLLPPSVIVPPGTGTDFGYMEALNWIWTHNLPLHFGTNIAYTYGPLGFLCYKVAGNWQLLTLILLFEIYIYANFIMILKAFMPVKSIASTLCVCFAILFFDKQFNESTYYLIFLFSVFVFLKTNNYRYLINAAFITLLCFFIKVNFGLIQLFVLSGVIAYSFWYKKISSYLLASIIAGVLAGLIALSLLLRVNIVSYVFTSLNIISGYNDAMVLPISAALKRFEFAFVVMAAYNLLAFLYMLRHGFKAEVIIRYLLVSLYIFIVFKYAFTRADLTTITHSFFVFAMTAISIQCLFESENYSRQLQQLAFITFIIAGAVYFELNPYMGRPEIYETLSANFVKDLSGQAKTKLTFSKEIKNQRLLPDKILKRIGNQSVDLMPYNISLLFINGLNYCPRPTLQSYTSYTPYLDSLNCKKYLSANGPDFVLFDCYSIDDREPFWDESATKRALLQNYRLVDSFAVDDSYTNGSANTEVSIEKYLVLEKRATPLKALVTGKKSGELALNEPLYVDTGTTPQYLYANFEYTLAGKIKSTLFQPALLYAVITYQNGQTDSFRAVRPVMETGVLINKKVLTANDASLLLTGNGAANQKIKSIKFVPTDHFSFKPKAKCRTELIGYSEP